MIVRHGVALAFGFLLAILLIAGCHVGPQVDQSDIGRKPHGASVIVQLKAKPMAKKAEHQGELLEVRDDGLVLLREEGVSGMPRVVLIPWGSVYRASASDLPGIAVRTSQGAAQRETSTEALRNVSRFPQGLSPTLAERLLAHYGQSKIETLD